MKLIKIKCKDAPVAKPDAKLLTLIDKLIKAEEKIKRKAMQIFPKGAKTLEAHHNRVIQQYKSLKTKDVQDIRKIVQRYFNTEPDGGEELRICNLDETGKLGEFYTYSKETDDTYDLWQDILDYIDEQGTL